MWLESSPDPKLELQGPDNIHFDSSKITAIIAVNNGWEASSTNEAQNCINKTVCG